MQETTIVYIIIPVMIVFSCCIDWMMGRSVGRFWSPSPTPEETELATTTPKKKKSKRDTTEEEVNNLPKILFVGATTADETNDKVASTPVNLVGTVIDSEAPLPASTTGSTTSTTPTDIENGTDNVAYHADECCICLEKFELNESLTSLPRCEHIFHPSCVGSWILERKKNVCPICKTQIFVDPPTTCIPTTTTTTTTSTTNNTNKEDDDEGWPQTA
jgi:Ring finger domain